MTDPTPPGTAGPKLSRREAYVRGELSLMIMHALLQIGPASFADITEFLLANTLIVFRDRFIEVRLSQLTERRLVQRDPESRLYDLAPEVRRHLQAERQLWPLGPATARHELAAW